MELRLPAFFILIHLQHSIIFVLLSDSLYETIFSKFLYESGISKMLEKYPLYDFFPIFWTRHELEFTLFCTNIMVNLSISLKRGMYYAHKTYHTGTAERFESRRKKNVITRIVWCYRHPEFHSRQLWERWKCRYVTWQSSDACRLLSCKHRLSSLSNWTTWTQISQYPICISMMIQIKYWLMKNIIHGYYQNYYLIKASINSWPTWKSILMILMIKVFR